MGLKAMTCRRMMILLFLITGCTIADCAFAQTTPLRFALRRDVGQEIQLQPNQRDAINALGPICDAQCQALVEQNFAALTDDARLAYAALPSAAQDSVVANQQADVREEVEMNAMDDVLADPQMDRFRQLWMQFQGIDSLTSGFASQAMDLSGDQLGELQELQIGANELINECQANTSLSPDQQSSIIQNINNGLIDQSINILNNGQLQIFIDLCGDACQFDLGEESTPPNDDTGDQLPAEEETQEEGQPNEGNAAAQSVPPNQSAGPARNRNLGSSTRNASNRFAKSWLSNETTQPQQSSSRSRSIQFPKSNSR